MKSKFKLDVKQMSLLNNPDDAQQMLQVTKGGVPYLITVRKNGVVEIMENYDNIAYVS